jgi:hypothetical protein
MALSNIFREPRREITESAVGITVFAAVVAIPATIAWYTANSMIAYDPSLDLLSALFLAVLIELVGVFVVSVLALLTHAIGEAICDALADRGVELRPTRRW